MVGLFVPQNSFLRFGQDVLSLSDQLSPFSVAILCLMHC